MILQRRRSLVLSPDLEYPQPFVHKIIIHVTFAAVDALFEK
jgi:hypothetical protein